MRLCRCGLMLLEIVRLLFLFGFPRKLFAYCLSDATLFTPLISLLGVIPWSESADSEGLSFAL